MDAPGNGLLVKLIFLEQFLWIYLDLPFSGSTFHSPVGCLVSVSISFSVCLSVCLSICLSVLVCLHPCPCEAALYWKAWLHSWLCLLYLPDNKRVSQSCADRKSAAPKWGLAHAPVNMADRWKKWMSVEKTKETTHFAALYYAIFRMQSFRKSLKVLWDFHRLFGSTKIPTTVIPATFSEACGPPEKLSLALANVLRMVLSNFLG